MLKFSQTSQQKLIDCLSKSNFAENYRNICINNPSNPDFHSMPNISALHLFVKNRFKDAKLVKKYSTIQFGFFNYGPWNWFSSIVLQRYGTIEPMLDGSDGEKTAGTTWLDLAIKSGVAKDAFSESDFFPPVLNPNRPGLGKTIETAQSCLSDCMDFHDELMRTIGLVQWT